MKVFEVIKKCYKPIQPAVKAENDGIVYHEVRPDKKIEDFVYCFWQLRTPAPLKTPFVYRVVSDGCIDIFFDHKQPSENFIMGFCRRYTEFPIGKEFDYIGIRFLPSAFPLLFGISAKSLSNQAWELKQILPHYSQWIGTNINAQQSFGKIIELLNELLDQHLQNKNLDFDFRFFNSLHLILQRKGVIDTVTDLRTGLSPRQLRRIFNFYIGATPKAFSNVIRFQYILNARSTRQDLRGDKLYYDAGFFDQAHFIKNFKKFYGVTPTAAFR